MLPVCHCHAIASCCCLSAVVDVAATIMIFCRCCRGCFLFPFAAIMLKCNKMQVFHLPPPPPTTTPSLPQMTIKYLCLHLLDMHNLGVFPYQTYTFWSPTPFFTMFGFLSHNSFCVPSFFLHQAQKVVFMSSAFPCRALKPKCRSLCFFPCTLLLLFLAKCIWATHHFLHWRVKRRKGVKCSIIIKFIIDTFLQS